VRFVIGPRPLLRAPDPHGHKDGNPLNEVELLAEALMNNDGVLRGNNVVKFVPDESVVKLDIGDQITLTAAQFAGWCWSACV